MWNVQLPFKPGDWVMHCERAQRNVNRKRGHNCRTCTMIRFYDMNGGEGYGRVTYRFSRVHNMGAGPKTAKGRLNEAGEVVLKEEYIKAPCTQCVHRLLRLANGDCGRIFEQVE